MIHLWMVTGTHFATMAVFARVSERARSPVVVVEAEWHFFVLCCFSCSRLCHLTFAQYHV
jgi:hypothetical protein